MEDRFQIVLHNNLKLPGQCLICGYGGSLRHYIDFGVQVRKYGRIYFCVDCFHECERIVNKLEPINSPDPVDTPQLSTYLPRDVLNTKDTPRSGRRPKTANTRTVKQNPK